MGIDVYMHWRGKTKASQAVPEALEPGSPTRGSQGYLRESYTGGPYATAYLLEEAFPAEGMIQIAAATLRERLAVAVLLAIERHRRNHRMYEYEIPAGSTFDEVIAEAIAPVIAEAIAPVIAEAIAPVIAEIESIPGRDEKALAALFREEDLRRAAELIRARNLPPNALSLVDFVELAERKERETGEPVGVFVDS
jgi:hypothetical protein